MTNPNFPTLAWELQARTGCGSTPLWKDITPRVTNWGTQAGRQYELGQIQSGTGTLTIADQDEALSPANLASPYNSCPPAQIQGATASTLTSTGTSVSIKFTLPTPGNTLIVAANSNDPLNAPPQYTLAETQTGNQYLYLWYKVADGTETSVTVTAPTATCFAIAFAEYCGIGPVIPVDVSASATRGTAGHTQTTGTTTTTATPTELVVCVVGPHSYIAASPPTSPSWSGGVTQRQLAATTYSTASMNSAIILGDVVTTSTGTQGSTCTWTNDTSHAGGIVVTFRSVRGLVPWRPVRCWAAWPLTGNLLNVGNTVWDAGLPDSSTFEGGTVGGWAGTNATPTSSTVRAHDGGYSMLVTWGTAATTQAYVYLYTPPMRDGVTYTLSAWVYVPSGGSPAVQLYCMGVAGVASSATNTWVRISVTFTAGSAYPDEAFLRTAGASTVGQTCYVDSVQLEPAGSATAFTTSGPVVYPIHTGYVERYPETWTAAGYHGWVSMTTVDALAALPKVTLHDCMTEDVQQDVPLVSFPMTDPPGSIGGRAFQAIGFSQGLSTVLIGTCGTPPVFGTQGGPGPDGASCVQLSPCDNTDYWGLLGGMPPGTWGGDIGSGTSMEIWFKTTHKGTDQCICVAVGFGGSAWDIRSNTSNIIYAQVTNTGGSTYDYTITGSATVCDGAWHHAVVTETASSGTVTGTLYLDGALQGTGTRTTGSAYAAMGWWIGGQWWPYLTQPFYGQVARFAWYRSTLTADRVRSHWLSGAGFPFDTVSDRITRVLNWMPWPGPTSIPDVATPVGAATGYEGKTITDTINALVVTENGPVYANPAGNLTLVPRQAYYQQTTPTWIFGENTAGGEYPYETDVGLDFDPTYLANEITVTCDNGIGQLATDSGSSTQYFPSTLAISTVGYTDSWSLWLAEYLVWRYAQPRVRVAQISFRPGGNQNLWPMCLGAKFGDRARVIRRTRTGNTYQIDCFIESISHTVDPQQGWTTAMQLSPVDPAPPIIIGTTLIASPSEVIVY